MRRLPLFVSVMSVMSMVAVGVAGAEARPPKPMHGSACDHGHHATTSWRPTGEESAARRIRRARAALVCEDDTGVLGQEPMLAINRRGTLFLGMASGEGVLTQKGFLNGTARSYLLRSRDDGHTWQRIALPKGINTSEGVPYIDRATDRLWVTSTNLSLHPCGAPVAWSDDEGASWHTTKRRPGCSPLSIGDWPKVFTGPYGAHRPADATSSRAAYVCNYIPAIWVALKVGCWRSDDDGQHFSYVGALPVKSLVCRAGDVSAGSFHTIVHGTGQVLGNGEVVVPVNLCGTMIVVRSSDHGKSWQVSRAIGRAGSLRAFLTDGESLAQNIFMNMFYDQALAQDAHGNLFLGYVRKGVHLAVSRDGGRTWRALGRISPPGVKGAFNVSVTARGKGQVALAWWGTGKLTDPLLGFGEKYRGWMTYSRNALARRPAFRSAPTSAVRAPQITNTLGCCASAQMFIEYSGVAFTGKRRIRAAFARFHGGALPTLVLGRMQLPR